MRAVARARVHVCVCCVGLCVRMPVHMCVCVCVCVCMCYVPVWVHLWTFFKQVSSPVLARKAVLALNLDLDWKSSGRRRPISPPT